MCICNEYCRNLNKLNPSVWAERGPAALKTVQAHDNNFRSPEASRPPDSSHSGTLAIDPDRVQLRLRDVAWLEHLMI